MGNSLYTDVKGNDKRFNENNLFAKSIKNLIIDQDATYTFQGKPLKVHVSKACCRDVIRPDIDKEPTNVVSVAFPEPFDLNDPNSVTDCRKSGRCLGVKYVGFQINDNTEKYCGSTTKIGQSGQFISRNRGVNRNIGSDGKEVFSTTNSICDNFMLDHCARNLYDQGCIKLGKNHRGATVAKYDKDNKMCVDIDNRINYGPPECQCLNSIYGKNLNTWPAREIGDDKTNPYGLPRSQTSADNDFSKYSLNIFNAKPNKQYPKAIDDRCKLALSKGDTFKSKPYTLADDENGNLTICLNEINFIDSDIQNLNMSDIRQDASCGNAPSVKEEPAATNIPVSTSAKTNLEAQAAEDKAKIDAANAAKARVLAEEKANADAAEKKKQEIAKALEQQRVKDQAEQIKNKKIEEEKAAMIKAQTDAKIKMAIKAEADAIIKKQQEAENLKKQQEAENLKKQQAPMPETMLVKSETSELPIAVIGGGVLLLVVIAAVAFFLLKKKAA
jgi:hypothetical protein